MIFEDFFNNPHQTKRLIDSGDMRDEVYADGVIYPNIIRLPLPVEDEAYLNLSILLGPIVPVLSFARYSFSNVKPPHWAHSDREIAQYVALIYLNDREDAEKFGTCTLRHKWYGLETHPHNNLLKSVLIADANRKNMWDVTFTCPGRFNRIFILNTELIHAACGEYGRSKEDGRLVVSVFFNFKGDEG